MTAGYADLGNGKLYYEMEGKGETLVLCHAGFVDSRMWDGQWDSFIKHYRVLRFDMRGFGKSDPATGLVSRRMDLYNLLQKLGIDRANLLGCSMGAEMIIDFTFEYPEKVSSLVIVSGIPGGFEMQGEPPSEIIEMLQAIEEGDLERVSELQIRLWVDGIYRHPQQVDPEVRQHAAEMNRIAVENGTWAKADAQPLNPLNPPAVGRLAEINVPTLIIAGSLDHPEVQRAADLLANRIRGAKKIINRSENRKKNPNTKNFSIGPKTIFAALKRLRELIILAFVLAIILPLFSLKYQAGFRKFFQKQLREHLFPTAYPTVKSIRLSGERYSYSYGIRL